MTTSRISPGLSWLNGSSDVLVRRLIARIRRLFDSHRAQESTARRSVPAGVARGQDIDLGPSKDELAELLRIGSNSGSEPTVVERFVEDVQFEPLDSDDEILNERWNRTQVRR